MTIWRINICEDSLKTTLINQKVSNAEIKHSISRERDEKYYPSASLSNPKSISLTTPDIHDWVPMPGPQELVNTPFIYGQMCPEKRGGDIGSQLISVMPIYPILIGWWHNSIMAISESQPKREGKLD